MPAKDKLKRRLDKENHDLTLRRTSLREDLVSSQQGFTLIELLIVIAVIGGLASIFVATYPSAQRKARDAERQSDIKQYQTALETYANSNNGLYLDSSGTTQMTGVCSGNLNVPNCPDDPRAPTHPSYMYNGVATEYVAWAQLEQPDESGNTQYFVTCSNGLSDTTTAEPTSSTCPL